MVASIDRCSEHAVAMLSGTEYTLQQKIDQYTECIPTAHDSIHAKSRILAQQTEGACSPHGIQACTLSHALPDAVCVHESACIRVLASSDSAAVKGVLGGGKEGVLGVGVEEGVALERVERVLPLSLHQPLQEARQMISKAEDSQRDCSICHRTTWLQSLDRRSCPRFFQTAPHHCSITSTFKLIR